MQKPVVEAGFNYSLALLHIRNKLSYAEIAEFCGYESPNAVCKVISGSVPSHPQGEAIWILYLDLFGRKPPMSLST